MFAVQDIKFLELKYNLSLRHLQQTALQPLFRASIQNLLVVEFPVEFVELAVVRLAWDLTFDSFEKRTLYQGLCTAVVGVSRGSDDYAASALSDELLELYHEVSPSENPFSRRYHCIL